MERTTSSPASMPRDQSIPHSIRNEQYGITCVTDVRVRGDIREINCSATTKWLTNMMAIANENGIEPLETI